jgi:hypothetical protein
MLIAEEEAMSRMKVEYFMDKKGLIKLTNQRL